MFLSIDECEGHGKCVLGLIAIPLNQVANLERDFCVIRLETKTMGEISWKKISKNYIKKYLQFLDLFLNNTDATFHSITYSRDKKYNAAYSLIRTVSWKLWNAGIKNDSELFILFDQNTEAFPKPETIEVGGTKMIEVQEFKSSYDAIKKISAGDFRFRHKITYCNQGASHQLGLLQLTDLLTGAMSAVINNIKLSEEHTELIGHIYKSIGHDFEASRAELSLPKLKSYKLHFLDPLVKTSG